MIALKHPNSKMASRELTSALEWVLIQISFEVCVLFGVINLFLKHTTFVENEVGNIHWSRHLVVYLEDRRSKVCALIISGF